MWNNPLRFIDPSGFQAESVTYNFDVGSTVTVTSYNFENTVILSSYGSVQTNTAVGLTAQPGLSADSSHYQHATPSNSAGLTWGSSFQPSLLTQVTEANPKFKEWEELGYAYLFLPVEILDWACLDGQCGPGGPTFAMGTVRHVGKREAASGIGLGIRNMATALRSASEAYKGTTRVGHALSKHAGRNPDIWGKITGNPSTWHNQAMQHFRDITRGPGSFDNVTDAKTGLQWIEKRLPDGRGMRLNLDYTFKGFVD